jgi:hypothetical protein
MRLDRLGTRADGDVPGHIVIGHASIVNEPGLEVQDLLLPLSISSCYGR